MRFFNWWRKKPVSIAPMENPKLCSTCRTWGAKSDEARGLRIANMNKNPTIEPARCPSCGSSDWVYS